PRNRRIERRLLGLPESRRGGFRATLARVGYALEEIAAKAAAPRFARRSRRSLGRRGGGPVLPSGRSPLRRAALGRVGCRPPGGGRGRPRLGRPRNRRRRHGLIGGGEFWCGRLPDGWRNIGRSVRSGGR